jgi:hypothetical protein
MTSVADVEELRDPGRQTFQLTLSTGKQTQEQMFTDPKAGEVAFLPLCGPFIEKIARARPSTKATYRSNFSNPQ